MLDTIQERTESKGGNSAILQLYMNFHIEYLFVVLLLLSQKEYGKTGECPKKVTGMEVLSVEQVG